MTEVHAVVDGPAPAQAGPEHGRPDGHDGEARVRELLGRMTLEEKLAQLVGFWEKEDGEAVAPLQGEFGGVAKLEEFSRHGLGHLTRAYGTRPVDAAERAAWLWEFQRDLVTGTRLGIPAIVHEECLTGLSAWKAATLPDAAGLGRRVRPRAGRRDGRGDRRARCGRWASTRDSRRCSTSIRDPRWGRVDECIAEDPYLVGTIGTSYVRGPAVAGGARHAQALRRLLRLARRAQLRPGARRRRASSPTCCSSRSRWRSSTATPARSCTPTPRSTGCRSPPTRRCSPACCGTSGASTAPSSPTTSGSRSCTCCTTWRATSATRPARR